MPTKPCHIQDATLPKLWNVCNRKYYQFVFVRYPHGIVPVDRKRREPEYRGSATINYTFCSDPTNASTCQPGTQAATGTNIHLGSAPIIGVGLDLALEELVLDPAREPFGGAADHGVGARRGAGAVVLDEDELLLDAESERGLMHGCPARIRWEVDGCA